MWGPGEEVLLAKLEPSLDIWTPAPGGFYTFYFLHLELMNLSYNKPLYVETTHILPGKSDLFLYGPT